MELKGARLPAEILGQDPLAGSSNYFIGNDPAHWRTSVTNYSSVRYREVWKGIDLIYYGNQRQIEYDFLVAPGADPSQIRLAVSGATPRIDAEGDLVLDLIDRQVRLKKPLVYQVVDAKRRVIASRYSLRRKREASFVLGSYDASLPLVIDPVLAYSTYLGGNGTDVGNAIAVDSSGSVYITGRTFSTNFPLANPLQSSLKGTSDVFVAKLTPNGSALVYSTYIGGSGSDGGNAIAVDSSGNAYVTGFTYSTNFPTASPLQASPGACTSGVCAAAFVTKLNATGSALVYSTYLGGGGGGNDDEGYGVAVDSAGSAYLTGQTGSSTFPIVNPLQATNGGGASGRTNAFLTKLNPSGTAFVYSTYLGGSGGDAGFGIAVDTGGMAYVAGQATSTNFPVATAVQPVCGGGPAGCFDAFVAKISATGSTLVYSSYLGGSGLDYALGIAVDPSGNAYVTGSTNSTNFPVANAVQSRNGAAAVGGRNAFVAKLNSSGTSLSYSTYLGGSLNDSANAIAVDASGNAYVTGATASTDFPTANPSQASNRGSATGHSNAFVTALSASGSALSYSTYLGGSSGGAGQTTDSGQGIAVDSSGNIYVFGNTWSTDFPTANPLQATYAGSGDTFVTKISLTGSLGPVVTLSPGSVIFGNQLVGTTSSSQAVTLTNSGTATLAINGIAISGPNVADFIQSNSCAATLLVGSKCVINVSFAPQAIGARNAAVTIADNASGSPQSITLTGTGTSVPLVMLSTTSLTFANQSVGTTSTAQTVTLTNTGRAALTIASVTVAGTNSSDFVQTNTCGTSVAPGGSCKINVIFSPKAAGTRTASVPITDNASGSPQSIGLTGTGLAPIVTLSSSQLTFIQTVGTTSPTQSVTLSNSGNAGLVIAGITIGETNGLSQFSQTNTCPANLAPGANCTVTIGFSPSWRGTWIASLAIADNVQGPQRISMTGFATAPTGQQPIIGALANAASYTLGSCVPESATTGNCKPYSPLASGTIVTLFGQYLADSNQSATSLPLPTNLAGAAIGLPPDSQNPNTRASLFPLLYASPSQINFVFPGCTPGFALAYPIFRDGLESAADFFSQCASFSPGIFTVNQTGAGQGTVLISGTAFMAAPIGALPGSRPANRGEFVSIYCTGLGAVSNDPGLGSPAPATPLSRTLAAPVVTIGGVSAMVSFSGLAPGFVALYQVDVQVPPGAQTGDAIPFTITLMDASGKPYSSNTVSIAVQ